MTHLVAVVAFDGISPFHLSVPTLVFGARVLGGPRGRYDVVVCTPAPGTVPTDAGYDLTVPHGLEVLERADSIVIPSWHADQEPPQELLDAVRAAHQRGARVIGLCLGAFVVAAAGIADGLEVATHWHEADRLAARYGAVRVRADVLWSDHGQVITSAGVAAALDCCLHVVRTDLGARVAEDVARSLVLAPHRDGSQAQFIREPVAPNEGGDEVDVAVLWALDRLEQPLDLDSWAASVHVSRRTFTRRFRARTGTSPTRWLLHQRLARAQVLLETTDEPIEEVARRSGFGTAAALRQHFAARFRTSPGRHRREFRPGP
jgi:transcriptional regulator GlxA family with amidase domain